MRGAVEGVQGWRWGRGWGPDGPSAVLQAPALACTAAVLCCPLLLAQAPCVAASRLPNTHTLTALPPTCPPSPGPPAAAVHQYDIVLDVSVVNRTADTMQGVTLELATMGDLKLVERPQAHTLAAGAQKVRGR